MAVYRLLVDGKEIGHPMNPTRAAKEVGRAPATIAKHYLPYLLSNGYIRRKKGCINPVLYERGPRAYELDALISRANVDATKGVVQGLMSRPGRRGRSRRSERSQHTSLQGRTMRTVGTSSRCSRSGFCDLYAKEDGKDVLVAKWDDEPTKLNNGV